MYQHTLHIGRRALKLSLRMDYRRSNRCMKIYPVRVKAVQQSILSPDAAIAQRGNQLFYMKGNVGITGLNLE